MTSIQRRGDDGRLDARRLAASIAADLRSARIAAGISQAAAARAAGISEGQWGRLERGDLERPDLVQLCRAGRALGWKGSWRYFPVGDPVRDAPQLNLLRRFQAVLGPPLRIRREVPLPTEGDLRAWDGMVIGDGRPFVVEGESHAGDLQALERRLQLKLRDDPRVDVLVLALTRSAHHRALLEAHREALRGLLPLDSAALLRSLRSGRRPRVCGIVLV
jgi:transcriptional regulator with XRE-family HTH domain